MKDDPLNKALSIIGVESQLPAPIDTVDSDDDFEFARNNIRQLIANAQPVIDAAFDVAQVAQHPRSFEAAATMMKVALDANRDLMELRKTKTAVDLVGGTTGSPGGTVHNNNLFVSSSEFMEMARARSKPIIEG